MKSNILQSIATILVSVWLIPVSCTVVTLGGAQVLEEADARKVSAGNTIHNGAMIVHTKGQHDAPFGYSYIGKEIPHVASLLMPANQN